MVDGGSPYQASRACGGEVKRRHVMEGLVRHAVYSGDVEGVKRILLLPDLPPSPQGLQSWADFAMALVVMLPLIEVARSLMVELEALGASLHSSLLYGPLRKGNDAMVLYLIREAQVDVNSPTCEGGITLLMLAAVEGRLEVVQCLVEERGVDIHAKDEEGLDVACWCARGGHVEVMRYLVEEVGMDVRAKYTDNGMDVLQVAASQDHVKLVNWLVMERGVDEILRSPDDYLPLIIDSGAIMTFEWLVTSCQPPAKSMSVVKAGLFLACQRGRLEILKCLEDQAGMPIPIQDEHGRTLLDVASSYGQTAVVQYPKKIQGTSEGGEVRWQTVGMADMWERHRHRVI